LLCDFCDAFSGLGVITEKVKIGGGWESNALRDLPERRGIIIHKRRTADQQTVGKQRTRGGSAAHKWWISVGWAEKMSAMPGWADMR
jgi:hypothetical protein